MSVASCFFVIMRTKVLEAIQWAALAVYLATRPAQGQTRWPTFAQYLTKSLFQEAPVALRLASSTAA